MNYCTQDKQEREYILNYKPKPGYSIIYRYSHRTGDYIGQTKYSMAKRSGENGIKYSYNNQTKWSSAIEVLGINNFYIEILDEVPTHQADYWEKYYIKKYNSWEAGYNSTKGGKDIPDIKNFEGIGGFKVRFKVIKQGDNNATSDIKIKDYIEKYLGDLQRAPVSLAARYGAEIKVQDIMLKKGK